MATTFLFWNLYGRHEKSRAVRVASLQGSIRRLAALHGVDVFLFAECGMDNAAVVTALNGAGVGLYDHVSSGNERVRFFSRFPRRLWTDRFRDPFNSRLSILELGIGPGLLVAGVHLVDRISVPTEAGRAAHARGVASDIRLVEGDAGYQRTVVAGDFNMNPFEQGMVEAEAMHALISRDLAGTVQRMGSRSRFPCFYNPTWGCFGDRHTVTGSQGLTGRRPPGTYFFSNTQDPANHFWNMYDQVLLRPQVMDKLSRLEILDCDGQERLVTREGRPKKATFADHLPILFELNL